MDKKVLRNLSYGVYVVTSKDGSKNVGCVANSVMQVTSNPVTVAISINHDNFTNLVIKKNGKVGISILKENTDASIIGTFGFSSSKDVDKFDNVKFKEIDEIPVLEDTCGYMICKVLDAMESDTHTVFLLEVISSGDYSDLNPMTYKFYHENLKGTYPKNAPTYEEKEELVYDSKTKTWRCSVCGYEYEGDSLPDDFICPICGVDASKFNLVIE